MQSRSRLRSGFTLIELLVVIAIIAILAAILFPVFAKAREKARQSSCSSNMKQIGLAFMQYAQDYDETYPAIWMYGPPAYNDQVSRIWWGDLVYPYTKSADIFLCPSLSGRNRIGQSGNFTPKVLYYGFSMNAISSTGFTAALSPGIASGGKGFYSGSYSRGMSIAEVDAPAESIMITDGMSYLNQATNQPEYYKETQLDYTNTPTIVYTSGGDALRLAGRHSDGFNAIWGDGHVKWVRFGASRPRLWTIQSD